MRIILILSGLLIYSLGFAQNPTAQQILDQIDKNMSSKNRVYTSEMIVHSARGSRSMEMKSWTAGDNQSFSEYLAPAREKGTKMLKLEDKLWMYSPSTDRIIQISGHMLRQSVMGSDLSYEDMMEDRKLQEIYNAELVGTEDVEGTECYVIDLIAKVSDVAYHGRKIWVDKSKLIPLKEELYAKAGKLLKRTVMSDVKKIEGRWYPTKIHYKDMLKRGDGTEFIITEIQFDVDIPNYIFTKAALK
jgi:outer membrane lipoprotein-sorting protein